MTIGSASVINLLVVGLFSLIGFNCVCLRPKIRSFPVENLKISRLGPIKNAESQTKIG